MSVLTDELAARIVERTMAVIGRNVNVMNAQGVILASGDPSRRRAVHEGALLAARSDRALVVDAAQARLLRGVQPGANVPLRHAGEIVGVIGISGDPEEVRVLAELIRVTAELMLDQAATLEGGQRRQHEREDHLLALITGDLPHDVAVRRAQELAIVDAPRRCTVLRADGPQHLEALRALQRRLARHPQYLIARTGPEELAVWWPEDPARPGREVPTELDGSTGGVRSVSGRAFDGPDGLRRAWRTAQDAWAVSRIAPELYHSRDLSLVALLSGLREDWRADALAEPWRALATADRHGELVATLRAWFDSGMRSQRCAQALHVHRNTLRGRLERIEEVTGLELARISDLVQLYLGPLLASGPSPAALTALSRDE